MTTIRYFVPEDGDTEEHPNIFLMPKSQNSGFSPRLREVKENFPMPGTYHFRFKAPLIPGSDREKNAVSVWMDCVDDNQHVGVWRNTIVAKVTRINMNDEEYPVSSSSSNHMNGQQQSSPQRVSAPALNGRGNRVQHAPRSTAPPVPPPVPASDNLLGLDDARPPTHPISTSAPVSNGSLLDDLHSAPPPPSSGEGSLLDMNAPTSYNNSVQNTSSHDDFLGMTSTPVSTTPAPAPTPVKINPAPSSYGMPRNGNGSGGAYKPNKAFETFANKSGPFGGLEWK